MCCALLLGFRRCPNIGNEFNDQLARKNGGGEPEGKQQQQPNPG